jgi:hypothetical protein
MLDVLAVYACGRVRVGMCSVEARLGWKSFLLEREARVVGDHKRDGLLAGNLLQLYQLGLVGSRSQKLT